MIHYPYYTNPQQHPVLPQCYYPHPSSVDFYEEVPMPLPP
eukprot:CAMPEP_0170966156 /NCGR_PEP_ID=MMETSP0735-20130129/41469_1 /TAXON_ID=186038 /ORGANISM="Fragilariopsis kerguelensis, Strain L26-C5" /LENGTH=39 /DNA_ID= /DNA_START= /DNA_END= /DNA_ORIENTATION=